MGFLIRLNTVGPAVGLAIMVVWSAAFFGYWGGWHDIFAQQTYQMEWVVVQGSVVAFVGLAIWIWLKMSRLLAIATVAVAALVLACQFGISPVPAYRDSVVPLQVGLVWFAAIGVAMMAHTIWSARRIAGPPAYPSQHPHRS